MLEDLILLKKDAIDVKDFYIDQKIIDTIKHSYKDGYLPCIVVNTSTSNTTFYSKAEYAFIFRKLKSDIRVATRNFTIEFIIVDGTESKDEEDKLPNPYIMYQIAIDNKVSLRDSVIIGDDISVMEFAYNAGIGTFLNTKDIYEA